MNLQERLNENEMVEEGPVFRLLIVEDQDHHIEDARKTVEKRQEEIQIKRVVGVNGYVKPQKGKIQKTPKR